MNPAVATKFTQLVLAELLASGLIIAGCVLAFRALTGKSQWFVKLPGFQAKLANASPGAVLICLGLPILWMSLHSQIQSTTVETTKTTTTPVRTSPAPDVPGTTTKETTTTTIFTGKPNPYPRPPQE